MNDTMKLRLTYKDIEHRATLTRNYYHFSMNTIYSNIYNAKQPIVIAQQTNKQTNNHQWQCQFTEKIATTTMTIVKKGTKNART